MVIGAFAVAPSGGRLLRRLSGGGAQKATGVLSPQQRDTEGKH